MTSFARAIATLLLALPGLAAQAASVDIQALGSDGKPLADAVVFLESPGAKAAARPLANVDIAQAERRFVQRVTVVTVGTEVHFPNRDKVRHHVYSFSPTKTFELKLYAGTPSNPVLFDRPGVAALGCNIHDNMVAWVLVVETPHFGQTDAKGVLHLDNVPPGTYRLRSWHPALPPGAPALDEALVVAAAGSHAAVKFPLAVAAP